MIVQGVQIARRLWKGRGIHKKGNTPYKIYSSKKEILKKKYQSINLPSAIAEQT